METTGNILRATDKFKNEYKHINKVKIRVDDDGLGGGVTDRLREVIRQEGLGYEVMPIKNGSKANDEEHYSDKSAEMWGNMRDILEENFTNFVQGKEPTIELPNNDKLIKQLSNRKFRIDSKGRIDLEKKEEMKRE